MSTRKIVILGSTGSIGKSTLDVVQAHPDCFDVLALAAKSNDELLEKQYRQFRPRYLCLVDEAPGKRLVEKLKDEPVEILIGEKQLAELAALTDTDLVLNAVVGAAGLKVSVEAVKAGKLLALANKESLVAGGPLFPGLCKRTGTRILPVDSEHCAIWQALGAGKETEARKILLTGSGGPFRTLPLDDFPRITVEQALNH
ncbi:MAG: 1-deoxy-D-xylulose-5-phosphate reductoisomerase, partial [Candidatus Zixiibacteriota bacterium]